MKSQTFPKDIQKNKDKLSERFMEKIENRFPSERNTSSKQYKVIRDIIPEIRCTGFGIVMHVCQGFEEYSRNNGYTVRSPVVRAVRQQLSRLSKIDMEEREDGDDRDDNREKEDTQESKCDDKDNEVSRGKQRNGEENNREHNHKLKKLLKEKKERQKYKAKTQDIKRMKRRNP